MGCAALFTRAYIASRARSHIHASTVAHVQRGPFTFFEGQQMLNASWSDAGDIVTYVMWDYYVPVLPLSPQYTEVCAMFPFHPHRLYVSRSNRSVRGVCWPVNIELRISQDTTRIRVFETFSFRRDL